jgi:hypothetical protein
MITAEQFKTATGYEPQDDDLERCNCPKAGELFHRMCGWDNKRNMPNFIPSIPVEENSHDQQ